MIVAWNAVSVPSSLKPTLTLSIWSRPWWVTIIPSERVSTHFTGRPSLRDAHAQPISSA